MVVVIYLRSFAEVIHKLQFPEHTAAYKHGTTSYDRSPTFLGTGLKAPGVTRSKQNRMTSENTMKTNKIGREAMDRKSESVIPITEDDSPRSLGFCGWIFLFMAVIFTIVLFPVTMFMCIKLVQEYERAVIFRLGLIIDRKPKGPGMFFVLPCIDTFKKVDLRSKTFEIPPQEILTKDSVTVSVDGVVYFRVSDPILSVANVRNADEATRLLAQTTLRNALGTKSLSEVLSDREGISHSMQFALDEATHPWGIKVERVEIKDVKLPVQLQRAMAAEAEASREARAKVIAAEGEMNASRALKEASLVIAESPSALQLRYLQTLNTISAEKNSTIIFPVPIDILQHFVSRK
ncbi:stomatin-like [Tachysurus fulvidraco]|uniref:stomatin-like n=1 Tax=Tachysurus fulvidraco TaxID=1234273 RepID=UPI001FEF36B0|nr:stomatin-like [Tachysurus fulvidraco]